MVSSRPLAIRVRERHRVSVCLSFSELSTCIQSGARLPRLYALVSAFVCTDYACPWESREAWGPHLLYFQMFETSLRDYVRQILHAASPGVKARRLACSFLLALEIGNDQASPWFEHTSDFRESLKLY